MRYNLHSSEIQKFYYNKYFKKEDNIPFSMMVDEIETGPLKMLVKEWKTPKLQAHMMQSKTDKDLQIIGGMLDKMAILQFVCEGNTSIERNSGYFTRMNKNTNNLFCAIDDKINHQFEKNKQKEYFKVFLSYDYIHSMANHYPEVFGTLSKLIENQCPFVLGNKHFATTMEMSNVIEQIKNSQDMGSLASFYFETKVHELLTLQMQQINKQDCFDCTCYKHYLEQINEARNIIENQYQNPPTIRELAKMVCMSETVLKASFKMFFGITIYGYLFDYRMNIARKILPNNAFTIAEIAQKSGYEYPSHFTTAFKRKFGITPKEFRIMNC